MNFWKDLEDFTATDERAARCATNYERGLLTYDEASRAILELYADRNYVFVVQAKEKRRGGKWQTYSAPMKYRSDAETKAREMTAQGNESINGYPIIYRVVPQLNITVDLTA